MALKGARLSRPSNTVQRPAVGKSVKSVLPCERQPQKLDLPKPCDFDKIQIRCSHCNKERKDFGEGVFWVEQTPKQKLLNNYPVKTNNNTLSVTSNSTKGKDNKKDTITIQITRSKCHDPNEHPSITITEPAAVGGKVTYIRGTTTLQLPVTYPADWFERNLAEARKDSGLKAIVRFFFPSPITYKVLVRACGQRDSNQKVFGSWAHNINVYPDDRFSLSISIPEARKHGKIKGGGKIGKNGDTYHSVEETKTTAFGHNVQKREYTESQTHGHLVLQQNDTVRDRKYGVREEYTVGQVASGAAVRHEMTLADKTDHSLVEAARSIKLSHNANDISNQFQFVAFVEKIIKLRKLVLDFANTLSKIIDAVPKIGWSVSYSIDVLSGDIKLDWGWKENPKDNSAFRNWKLKTSFTIINANLEISYGINIFGSGVAVSGSISIEFAISREIENTPDKNSRELLTDATSSGKLGVSAELGEFIALEGKLTAEIECKGRLKFTPLEWTVDVNVSETKGIFTAKTLRGIWTHTREKVLWKEWPLVEEFHII